MGKSILVLGEPGTGKSRAMLNLDPSKTVIISPNSKDLPFKGGATMYSEDKQNYFKISDFAGIQQAIGWVNQKATNVQYVIIEDLTHYFSERVMKDAKIKSYDKWTDLAVDAFNALIRIEQTLREDLWVIIIAHTTTSTDVQGNQIITLQTPGE